jgi:hypothetical protein
VGFLADEQPDIVETLLKVGLGGLERRFGGWQYISDSPKAPGWRGSVSDPAQGRSAVSSRKCAIIVSDT